MSKKYEKLDQITHIHKRPDMYVGTIKSKKEENEWISSSSNSDNPKFVKKDISYSQALLRIFIEPLSNAIDNVWRSKNTKTPCTTIRVNIDKETGMISIWNDGCSIPVEFDTDNNVYIPELIFGHLLSGSNYDDSEDRYTSGRNGLGVKLTNVFSKSFSIKILDPVNGLLYEKEWTGNMRNSKKEKIKKSKNKNGYTQVSWIPDFEKFKLKKYTDTLLKLYDRYVYDTAMITGVNVVLNDSKVNIKNITDYSQFFPNTNQKEFICMNSKECQVILTPSSGHDFEHICFTNGVFNKDGGVHLEKWCKDFFKPLLQKLNKPKKPQVNMKDIKKFFRFFINCTVVNPEFNSQSKTYLSSPNISTCVEKKNINSVMKWSVISDIRDIIKSKELLSMKKVEKRSKSFKKIDGFDPANNAGTKESGNCTLILTEGLSAKTYAVKGIEVGFDGKSGRDWYGIYPLRGKLLNVRNSSIKTISNNKEIGDVIKALGLKTNTDYTVDRNYKSLNYGKVMIMTDADCDGIHIASLIMNFFHFMYPSLLDRKDAFIISMQTPIVKVFQRGNPLLFYREENFLDYKNQHLNQKLKVKYYKGLGTSSDKEIKDTFGKRVMKYIKDVETDQNMNKAFHNKSSDKRKKWLTDFDPDKRIDSKNLNMSISDFIDNDLIKFSIDDCGRSIPNIFDGFKESHRKIFYACILKNLKPSGKSIKVAQLAGFVAEKTNYHHGEQCLFDTITKMAQDFPGSNNIPYLQKDGQFGSRLNGGKDAANARYIYTKLHKLARFLFPEEDDGLLTKRIDDGDEVEPEFYLPIIPMILVNGCTAGIGTGWSCTIPQFNPLELVESVKTWIKNKTIFGEDDEGSYSLIPELTPWYRKHNGKIEKVSEDKYISYGNCISEKKGRNTHVIVNELPVMMWTDKFKEKLEDLLEKKSIKNMKNYSTPDKVRFVITESIELRCDVNTLKLKTHISTSNMVLFTENNKLKKFYTVDDIIEMFCIKRYTYYQLRKKSQLKKLNQQLKIFGNKYRFLQDVMNDKLVIFKKDYNVIVESLTQNKYDKYNQSYDYLLNMNVRSFTNQRLQEYEKDIKTTENNITKLSKTTEDKIWLNDLNKFVKEYNKYNK